MQVNRIFTCSWGIFLLWYDKIINRWWHFALLRCGTKFWDKIWFWENQPQTLRQKTACSKLCVENKLFFKNEMDCNYFCWSCEGIIGCLYVANWVGSHHLEEYVWTWCIPPWKSQSYRMEWTKRTLSFFGYVTLIYSEWFHSWWLLVCIYHIR